MPFFSLFFSGWTRRLLAWGSLLALLPILWACRTGNTAPLNHPIPGSQGGKASVGASCLCPTQQGTVGQWTSWPSQAKVGAGKAFWKAWGDGRAEMNSYNAKIERYGQSRTAELVLIYVTEPMNRQTWIKDDAVSGKDRISTLKLNISLKFKTGLYPYSVMTSVFSPVDHWRKERFSPAKITLSAQDWCGHVFASVWPSRQSYLHQLNSYFSSEGEKRAIVPVQGEHLYEDALLIQLRELSGVFNGGKAWKGKVIPSLWRNRKKHRSLLPQDATLTRKTTTQDGKKVHQFTLTYTRQNFTQTYTVEADGAQRMLGWTNSDGEVLSLNKSLRLPYWNLSSPSDSSYRKKLGLQ